MLNSAFCIKNIVFLNTFLYQSFNNNKSSIRSFARIMKTKDQTLGAPARQRPDPAVCKINSPEFQSIFTDELKELFRIFNKYNYELRIAGGAVRDILMEIHPKDVDFATIATPDQMKEMFSKENIRLINTKGEKHGTITPRINNKENFEVTTLRVDVRTDGRHAEVEYTTDWQLDANRRDLTINSMYLAFDGTLYDYFYGYEDLKERRVTFVGDADVRIKEDYLRILRYFRFYGRIAKNPNNHDLETLEIIARNADGLKGISGERIWSELKKIVVGNFNKELVLEMLNCKLGQYCGLPPKPNVKEFERVCRALKNFKQPQEPILYMSALLNDAEEAVRLHARLKLSGYERDLCLFITQNRDRVDAELVTLLDFKKYIVITAGQKALIKENILQLLKYMNKKEFYEEIKDWEVPHLPVPMDKLSPYDINEKDRAVTIKEIKVKWANSNFTLTLDEILETYATDIKNRVKASKESQIMKKVRKY